MAPTFNPIIWEDDMGYCIYGFHEPEKDICGDETSAGSKYCEYHRKEVKMNRSCGHPWGEHPYLFDHELEESDPKTLALEEKLHPCSRCMEEDAEGAYLSDLDSGYYDRDPRDYD
jgi:hypothetical protein